MLIMLFFIVGFFVGLGLVIGFDTLIGSKKEEIKRDICKQHNWVIDTVHLEKEMYCDKCGKSVKDVFNL